MTTEHYTIKKEIAWRKMQDGTMTLISPLDDSVLTLNGIGARVFELLADNLLLDEIVIRIQKETSHKDSKEIHKDIVEFIESLTSRGFLSAD